MKIKPTRKLSSRTGTLDSKLKISDIETALGFPPNCSDIDDSLKVENSWGFQAQVPSIKQGKSKWVLCGIWDYKGSRWSTFGPAEVFEQLFPGCYSQ